MELLSERLVYQKFTPVDLTDYLGLAMDASVMQYITGKALTEADGKIRFANYLQTNEQHPEAGFFSVRIRAGSAFAGLAKFVYTATDQVEVGYSLLPYFWGQRYASELVGCLLKYAATLPHITQLIAFVDPANAISARILTNYHFIRVEEDSNDASRLCYQLNRPFYRP